MYPPENNVSNEQAPAITDAASAPSQRVRPTAQALSPDYKYLWEEYKLLQDKVDKIGTFRFQVKSWLIPLVSAWIAAVYTAKLPAWTIFLSLAFVASFYLLEELQTSHQEGFIKRISALEDIFLRTERGQTPILGLPGLKRKVTQSQRKQYLDVLPTSPVEAIEQTNNYLKSRCLRLPILWAHSIFYILISAVVVVTSCAMIHASKEEANRTVLERKHASVTPLPTDEHADLQHEVSPSLLPSISNDLPVISPAYGPPPPSTGAISDLADRGTTSPVRPDGGGR